MVDRKLAVPLSPPISPPMSAAGFKSDDYNLQPSADSTYISADVPDRRLETAPSVDAVGIVNSVSAGNNQTTRPTLRSYKSFPYSLGPSSRVQDATHQDRPETNVLGDFAERVLSAGPQPTASANLHQPTYGGSAPASPVGQFSEGSLKVEEHDVQMEDEDVEFGNAEDDEDATEKRTMTAAELRAHKRKMKRFRLTHNQTRFLVSEFARQAHPDAAHRERLSREIPGLSPRQVQVWFQNRRAKLKRLTTDDRERMMRSRALPANFDTTQALHSPFSTPNPNMTTPVVSNGVFTPFGNGGVPVGARPLTVDTMRRVSDYDVYPPKYPGASNVMTPMGGYAFTPPQSATDAMSPGSAASHVSSFNFQTQESPRRPSIGMPYGSQPGYATHQPPMPRLNIHDRITRPGGDVVSSPLRRGMSYGLGGNIVSETRPERSNSLSESSYTHERPRQSRSSTISSTGGAGPYGLGFSYSNGSVYQPVEQHRPTAAPQSALDFQQPRRNMSNLTGPPMTYSQYPSANLPTSQVSQYANFSTGFVTSSYQNPYQYQPTDTHNQQGENPSQLSQQTQQSYATIQSQPQHLLSFGSATGQQDEPGDNSDGGVPVHINY